MKESKKIKSFISFILIVYFLPGCKDEEIVKNSEGAITSMPYVWKASVSDDGKGFPSFFTPLVHEEGVLFYAVKKEDDYYLSFKDKSSGNEIWQWKDHLESGFWDVETYHIYNDKVVFNEGPYFYSIDLTSGRTIWKGRLVDQSFRETTGYGSSFFFEGESDEELVPKIYKGSTTSSEISEILIPPIDSIFLFNDNKYGFIDQISYLKKDDKDYLFIPFASAYSMTEAINYIALYNLSEEKYVYDKIQVTEKTGIPLQGIPKVSEDKIYFSIDRKLMCYDVFTGKKNWSRSFDNILFRYTVAEGKVFALCEDTYLYAYNAETGSLLWKEKAAGLPSELVYMNGVLYFTAAGDGYLHAVDTETGKHIWLLRCPDEKINSNAYFKSEGVAVLPGENGERGRVFASGFLHAYCYEAAK